MTKQIQQGNHTLNQETYQLMLPLELGIKIEASQGVRLMLEITERLDYSKLEASYIRQPRESEASLKQMFQLVTLGFMEGNYSTRKLESACKHDIRFMYVLRGKRAPDHNRFWSFIKYRLQGKVAEHLFYQVASYLEEAGEIDYTNVFIDGTKIEQSANKYSFVWKKSTNKYEARLDVKIENLLMQISQEYPKIKSNMKSEECLTYLKSLFKDRNISFVYGRGKRKTQLQRDIETLESYLVRKVKYQSYNETFKNRNSFSKTDNYATFMGMKDDHMMNGQLKPAYNLQLAVEGEYIVGLDISCERSDMATLIPLLEPMEKGSGKKHENITADVGYESEENYKALKPRNQTAYIKPANYEKSKKRKYKINTICGKTWLMTKPRIPILALKVTYFHTSTQLSAKAPVVMNLPSQFMSARDVPIAHRKNIAPAPRAIEKYLFQRILLLLAKNHLLESPQKKVKLYALIVVFNAKGYLEF